MTFHRPGSSDIYWDTKHLDMENTDVRADRTTFSSRSAEGADLPRGREAEEVPSFRGKAGSNTDRIPPTPSAAARSALGSCSMIPFRRKATATVSPPRASVGEPSAAVGTEPGADGQPIGRDPRRMNIEELRALGHIPMSPQSALRARCLDCCAGSADEVRKCIAVRCASWPFRMGVNPWRSVSEGRREAGRRLAAKRAEKAAEAKSDLNPDQQDNVRRPKPHDEPVI